MAFRPLTLAPLGCHHRAMTCQECHCEAEGRARGWEALLVDLDDDGEDEAVFYCPACAESSTGWSERTASAALR